MTDENDVREPEGLTTADLAGTAEPRREEAAPTSTGAPAGSGDAEPAEALFPGDEAGDLRARWDSIQASFVDEPRRAVQDADGLVAQAMKRLAEIFASERQGLEAQWDRGDDLSTEDLRVALRKYRSFFTRLLSM